MNGNKNPEINSVFSSFYPPVGDVNFNENNGNNLYPNCDSNIWLRSCEKEIIEPINGKVKGKIPIWLEGVLLRNGPGSMKIGNDYFNHLFDSSALVHRFKIKNGNVTYQCRFIQSDVYKKNKAANRIVTTGFGTKATPDPCQSIFKQVAAIFTKEPQDNSLISLYPFDDEIYAFNETPIIHKINPNTLETEGNVDVSKYITIVHHTSHPHVMPDGTVFNLGMSIKPTGPYYNIICFPPKLNNKNMFEQAEFVANIPARWPLHPSYMHSFGITENYFLIVEQPLSISMPAVMINKFRKQPVAEACFRWYPEEMTQIEVLDRKTGQLAYQFYSEAFFYLHLINQYEITDYIVLDVCIYKDPSMLNCMYVNSIKTMHQNNNYAEMFRSRPVRFVLPLKPDKSSKNNLIKLPQTSAEAYIMENDKIIVIPEKLCNLGCETPRINYENYLGKPYRYFYAISADVDAENPGTIIKVDTVTKGVITWCETNCYPSEPIFVPNEKSQTEDDGIVLSVIIWGGSDTNHVGIIILNAKTLIEIARAEFYTTTPIPKCLHGWFLPDN